MRRSTLASLWLIPSLAALLLAHDPRASAAGQTKLNGHTFTLPDGFIIEQIAGPPLVDRPIVADFDEQGRLYVADSSGSNDPVQKQLAEKPHRIVRLEDTDGDGRFDRRTVFADRMMFPEGALWFDGSLYVSAPPSIWKLTDTDGDGVADQREEWFQGKTLTVCANDLHGPYLGPDGWIYWAKGAFAKQSYERPGQKPFVTRAAHLFRWRPDRSGPIEPVMTGGMDNPVDVVFTPSGERIFTTTFFQHPGGGQRDGLIHAIYGGVYGKIHDVIDEHPRTSPDVMPVLVHLGPAAPCGFTSYESDVFGPDYQDNLFAALFNLQKITRHVLSPRGATFTTSDSDFLVSDNKDFHPTDVLADADGSLIVIDTGGWYKLCCPSSQLWKPDLLGAIYRVRREGAPHVDDPRGLMLDWASMSVSALTGLLNDSRPAVRARAIQTLAKMGPHAVPALAEVLQHASPVQARRNAVWALTRIDDPSARAAVREALHAEDETIRQAAGHSISVWRDHDALPLLLAQLKRQEPQNRRVAAEALGRIGDRSAVPALLEATAEPADRALEHSLIFALIEIDDPQGTSEGLSAKSPLTRKTALIALDQMEGGGLKPEEITPYLSSTDPALRATASWIVGRHPDWGEALVGYLRDRLKTEDLSSQDRAELERLLARFAGARAIQELLADRASDGSASLALRLSALRAMAQSGMREVPRAWVSALAKTLASDNPDLLRQAVATTRALPAPKAKAGALRAALLAIANRAENPADLRLVALAALPGGLTETSAELFSFLKAQLDPDQPVASKTMAADVLAKAKLTSEQLRALVDVLKTAGPLEMNAILTAFDQSSEDAVGEKLIETLRQLPALPSLREDALKPHLAKFGARVQRQAEALYTALSADAAQQKAKIEQLLTTLSGGDIRRGQAVFNSPKAACASCHAIGYLGGQVGPDLTKIGQIRTERDLLESIVFPSASFVRSYEPVTVATKDGRVLNGLIRKDAPDELILATGPDQEARVARDEIDEIRPSSVSIMPAGLDQQLTPQEIADLVTFLKACR
jgi:putative membrane-bound dehydrogenase-like protein